MGCSMRLAGRYPNSALANSRKLRAYAFFMSASPRTWARTTVGCASAQSAPSTSDQNGSKTRPATGVVRATSKRKLALLLGYDGAPYYGLQRNAGVHTVVDDVEDALYKVGLISANNYGYLSKVNWTVSARTDKGVSSAGNVVSFKAELARGEAAHSPAALAEVTRSINAALPDHLRIFRSVRVTSSFSARQHCDERSYEYLLPRTVLDGDLERFNGVLSRFYGSHNFHNYTVGTPHAIPPPPQSRRVIRAISCSTTPFVVEESGQYSASQWVRISIRGQSFMLHQIRKMVAMAILVHQGAVPEDTIERSLSRDFLLNIPPAPAVGLFLDYCDFGNYNLNQDHLAQPVGVYELDDVRERFKREVIFPSIVRRAENDDDMEIFFNTVSRHASSFEEMLQSASGVPATSRESKKCAD